MFDKVADFLGQGWVLGLMGVLLLALIGGMIFMRMNKSDDE